MSGPEVSGNVGPEVAAGAVISANLPSRDFDETEAFYTRLGFTRFFRTPTWMILTYGSTQVEFFPHPDLRPEDSWFSACLRVEDLADLGARWLALGFANEAPAIPRVGPMLPQRDHAPAMFTVIDPNGSLWRVMERTPASD